VLTTEVRQAILHSISDIMAVAAADVMDMDKAVCSISRILPVRHPWYPDNNTYAFA
jgi:hypothetical protein